MIWYEVAASTVFIGALFKMYSLLRKERAARLRLHNARASDVARWAADTERWQEREASWRRVALKYKAALEDVALVAGGPLAEKIRRLL